MLLFSVFKKQNLEGIETTPKEKEKLTTQELVKRLYKDDKGDPIVLSESQIEIFECIYKRKYPRVHIMTTTQFGKSMTVALAVLTRAATFPEKWCIVAPSEKKAKIIMGYIIQHAFDNEYTSSKLELDKEGKDRLRRERSKQRITFRISGGKVGEIFILSADSRNKEKAGEALMGFGAPNVIEDESALLSDEIHAKVMRMLGGHSDNLMVKIGNPFYRNHFYRSYKNPQYHQIIVDYKQAIKEKGDSYAAFIEEMRGEHSFDVFYECKFPDEDSMDSEGWMPLLTSEEIERAQVDEEKGFGIPKLGVDAGAGGGRDYSSIVKRYSNVARIIFSNNRVDIMAFAGHVVQAIKEGVPGENTWVDRTGLGLGVYERLRELGYGVKAFTSANLALQQDKYFNLRAESYWRLREWIKGGGKIIRHKGWDDLNQIKYRVHDSTGRLQIISKDDMRRKGLDSPDEVDALMMTFALPEISANLQAYLNNKKKKKKKEDSNFKQTSY